MAKYKTLKRAAGLHNFGPGEEIELTREEAKDLLADKAIEPIKKEATEAPDKT